MVREHAFDLGRAHVDAAGDDEILHAVDDPHPAVVVDRADVAGVEPTVGVERFRGPGRIEPVAAHHHRAAHEDLAVGGPMRASAPSIGTPSSAKPPHVSESPYASTTARRRLGARSQRGRARRAADDHAAELVQRRARVEQPPQRGRDERHDRRAFGARCAGDAVEVEAVVHACTARR